MRPSHTFSSAFFSLFPSVAIRNMFRRVVPYRFFPFVFFLLAAIPVFAEQYGDVTVQYVPMYTTSSRSPDSTHGYVEHRFRVQNAAATGTKTVTIRLGPGHSYLDSGLRSAVGSVEVPAGQTAQLLIFQPPVALEGGSLNATVAIDGRRQRDVMFVNIPGSHCQGIVRTYYGGAPPGSDPMVLVSIKTPTDFRDLFERGDPGEELLGGTTGTVVPNSSLPATSGLMIAPQRNLALWRSESDCDQWSENWLAYTRFDAIALTDAEIAAMPQPVWNALQRYVECGGTLCVVGLAWTPPPHWIVAESGGDFGRRAVLGRVFLVNNNLESAKSDILAIRRNVIMTHTDTWTRAMSSDRYGSSGFFSDPNRVAGGLAVSHSTGVPIQIISILIIVFAVLIGPVNVYVLSIKNRRIWLLWTVPAISILASGLVLGTNFFREGFVKYESSSTVTILDQRRGEALTFGVLGFYSTLTPREIAFENGTESTAVVNRENRLFEIVNRPGGEQVFSSGWVQPRVPAYFGIRKAESRKERLVFQFEDETPTVTNQLGTDIDELTVCAPDGTCYGASNIIAGQKVELTPDASSQTSSPDATMHSLSQTYWRFDGWSQAAQSTTPPLSPGTYLLRIEDRWNPFLEKVIAGSTPFENHTTIVGFFGEK